jgi:hypothetical protein
MGLLRVVNVLGMLALAYFQLANLWGILFNSGHRMQHAWGLFQWFIIAIVFQVSLGWISSRLERNSSGGA